jgi:hypothetical protein
MVSASPRRAAPRRGAREQSPPHSIVDSRASARRAASGDIPERWPTQGSYAAWWERSEAGNLAINLPSLTATPSEPAKVWPKTQQSFPLLCFR